MKEFKTLTIRNLDRTESSDLVEIINKVIDGSDCWNRTGTAQKAIEYIIRQYREQERRIKTLKSEIENQNQEIRTREIEARKYKQFFSLISELQKSD